MNIYTDLQSIPDLKKPVITIGTFDGIHLGHKKIIDYLLAKAQDVRGESVVFTFHPHPRVVLHPDDHGLELIQTIEERVEKFRKLGVENLIIFPFSVEFSRLTATQFVRDILVDKLNIHTLIIGYDHHFGRNREGSMQNLLELAPLFGFEINEIAALIKEDTNISSTKIRNALKTGDLNTVYNFLGENYKLGGKVESGDKIGSTIGFPTANIGLDKNCKLIPSNGVYAVKVKVGNQSLFGMVNIGNRPTISENGAHRIEVHIFDFNKDIYSEQIEIEFVMFIRDETSFKNIESLKQQLKKDEAACRNVLLSNRIN